MKILKSALNSIRPLLAIFANPSALTQLSVLSLLVLCVFSRLLPHPPNFTALGATALTGVALCRPKFLGLLLPIVALIITDYLFFGFHSTMIAVYGSFLLVAGVSWALGAEALKKKWALFSVFSSGTFFVVTNFAVWLSSAAYTKDLAGLGLCFMMALPFLGWQLIGDLFFTKSILLAARFFENKLFQSRSSAV